jgi:ATP phosphoribosyltransferase regulatory subunit
VRSEPTVPSNILAAIRAPFAGVGAQAVDAPLLQPLSLLLDLAGETMRQRLFVVQAEGGPEYCLRPDFTVAIARRHLESGAAAGRYSYEGAAFRAEPDSDGAEECLQIGLEVFDPAGPALGTEIEIIDLAWRSALAGGRKDLTLWLGDVGLFSAFVDGLDLPPTLTARLKRAAGRPRLLQAELARAGEEGAAPAGGQLAAMLSALPHGQAVALLEETWALAGIEPVGGRGPAEIAERLVRRAGEASAPALTLGQADAVRRFLAISNAPHAALADVRIIASVGDKLAVAFEAWTARLAGLTAASIPEERMRLATALGHAFDYYDGLTFEVRSEGLESAIAVGGRYDSLLARLGGTSNAQAVGCMVRPWRAFSGGEA